MFAAHEVIANVVSSLLSEAAETLNNGAHVFAKVIVISDGKPTEVDLVAGPDIEDLSKIDEVRVQNFRKKLPTLQQKRQRSLI